MSKQSLKVSQPDTRRPAVSAIGVDLHHPAAFWVGVVMLMTGVLLHLPDYISMKSMGYQMAGMPMSDIMLAGMVLIVVGLPLSGYGLMPHFSALYSHREKGATEHHIRAMDDAKLTGTHWWLLFVLGVALVVDIMKPATLGFVVPGMRHEYDGAVSHAHGVLGAAGDPHPATTPAPSELTWGPGPHRFAGSKTGQR